MAKKDLKNRKTIPIKLNGKTRTYLLSQVEKRLKKDKKTIIFTPNPEFVVLAKKDISFRRILDKADISLADGSYLFWANYIQDKREKGNNYHQKHFLERFLLSLTWGFGGGFRLHCGNLAEKRISGTDFILDLLGLAQKHDWPVFFLGAAPGVAHRAAEKLKVKFPKLKVAGCFAGNGSPEGDKETGRAIKRASLSLKKGKISMLFVAYGMGKQEQWIIRNLPNLPVNMAMGVGGAFDYHSELVSRAPVWLRKRSGEWIYRLVRQPWRLKRQLALWKFLWLVLTEQVFLNFEN